MTAIAPIVAAAPRYAVGDRVFLGADPRRAGGTVAAVMGGRYLVRWDDGSGWIYAGVQLARQEV